MILKIPSNPEFYDSMTDMIRLEVTGLRQKYSRVTKSHLQP